MVGLRPLLLQFHLLINLLLTTFHKQMFRRRFLPFHLSYVSATFEVIFIKFHGVKNIFSGNFEENSSLNNCIITQYSYRFSHDIECSYQMS
jgi:hypothetical protein